MNNNMINPANYYNPFAKYNYVSKTRGAFVPQDANINNTLWSDSSMASDKTSSIWSDNYDAQLDIKQGMEGEGQNNIIGFFTNILRKKADSKE